MIPNTCPATPSPQFTKYHHAVGILRSIWLDAQNRFMCINYATAFAVAPKIIMTCSHNLYLEKNGEYAHVVQFYPDINWEITNESNVYTSNRNEQTWKTTEPDKSFSCKPLPEELTLIELEEQIKGISFIKVGNKFDENRQNLLQIIGYPSSEYQDNFKVPKAIISRIKLDGQLFRIYQSTVQYTMNTAVGFGGSPIFAVSEDRETICVGVHTHKGFLPGINSGLFFSKSILNKIRYFEEQIMGYNPAYLYDIDYSEKDFPQLQEYDQATYNTSEIELHNLEESVGEQLSQTSQVFSQEYCASDFDYQMPNNPFYCIQEQQAKEDQAKEELNQFQLDQMEKSIPQQQQCQVLNQGHCASDKQMPNNPFFCIQEQQAKEEHKQFWLDQMIKDNLKKLSCFWQHQDQLTKAY